MSLSLAQSEIVSPRTLGELGMSKLTALCGALGMKAEAHAILEIFRRTSRSWSMHPAAGRAIWASEVGDDQTPFELSVAFRGGATPVAELRFMVEPLGSPPSIATNRDVALALLESLGDLGVDSARLALMRELFLPDHHAGRFAMWIAAAFAPGERPVLKAYFDAWAHGRAAAPALVEETLTRLGFPCAWPLVSRHLLARGRELDELTYVSIDLAPSDASRLKLYARHHRATPADLEHAAAACSTYSSGAARRFLALVAGPHDGVFAKRGPFTCLSFVRSHGQQPAGVTLHFPVNAYAPSDAAIRERLTAALPEYDIDPSAYRTTIDALAQRGLDRGVGMQSYVSLRADLGQPRVTVYLPMEAYAPGTIAPPNAPCSPASARAIVSHYENDEPITQHPFARRLRREPPNLGVQYALLANFQAAISRKFAGHLAGVAARVTDEPMRCILARQLADELGNGVWERAHVNLFTRMMQTLEGHRPSWFTADCLAPGVAFDRNLTRLYDDPDSLVAVGAVMLGEVYGKQIDLFIGEEFRREGSIDMTSLDWLVLHEQLEVEHAEESFALADRVPSIGLDAVRRGACEAAHAGWTFLDDLYELCFGRSP